MVLMYLCVFDEFVLIGVCFGSGLSVSVVSERVKLWFWTESLTYMYFFVCVSGAAEPMLNLHRHGKCEKLYFCCELAI